MPELLPTLQARRITDGLVDYLATTFALADAEPRRALDEFLRHERDGLFKGPYVRLRLPFRAADPDWRDHLDWTPGWTPYRHQAQAYARLTSLGRTGVGERPEPTLITTGTGSGKTEAFLHPILDHVLRAKRAGTTGMKALILYPMNALADDQARRLAATLAGDPALRSVTAGIYTGNQTGTRTRVSSDGLITDRHTLRDTSPDILLTNYKMLDQLLLRPDDQPLWERSARSLQYLVLDEFHTYDGAQGTDVAMLLRRLGLALKSHWREDDPTVTDAERARPLGRITPVATSATLGDKSDPSVMLDFAATVFGEPFGLEAVVTETMVDYDAWAAAADPAVAATPRRLAELARDGSLADLAATAAAHADDPAALTAAAVRAFHAEDGLSAEDAPALLRRHPDVRALVEAAAQARPVPELLAAVGLSAEYADHVRALEALIGALSHVRASHGRDAVSVELHLWVRELTRVDRVASAVPAYRWSDDGPAGGAWVGAEDGAPAAVFPAVYCRHCGRSGWGVSLAPTGDELAEHDADIRRDHAAGESRFRALLHAPGEDERERQGRQVEGLRWFDVSARRLLPARPAEDDPALLGGHVLSVLTQTGQDADQRSNQDDCPACGRADGIRFLGAAIATLLSVTLSVLYGDPALDEREKKALVFTDSVQDAAHRAGFVQARSHAMSLRTALGAQVGTTPTTLETLVDDVLAAAGDDAFARYRLVPPDALSLDRFRRFWAAETAAQVSGTDRRWVKRRLLFDATLEFGLQTGYGRTLEATGGVGVAVEAGPAARLAAIARGVLTEDEVQTLDAGVEAVLTGGVTDAALTAWVRGVLEHIRRSGGIHHEWLEKYLAEDGRRYRIWGGRPKTGMPAFPKGRSAPAFPRVGGANPNKESDLETVRSAQGWYAKWTVKNLGVAGRHGAKLAERLLAALARDDVLREVATDSGASVYGVPAGAVTLRALTDEELASGAALLVCDTCQDQLPATPEVVAQLNGAPCTVVRCDGSLRAAPREDTFYRRLYRGADMRRIVSAEHTSLIADTERRRIEDGFKRGAQAPDDPNVLVATPTLEMGIDIGDLSAVMLSSLPRAVAQYVQRVGRAGRLTGNAFTMAFVTGRGDQLPRLGDPASLINGAVRPPATYLDAEEILRRQYLASLADAIARRPGAPVPQRASDVLTSAADGTFLGDLLALARDEAEPRLDAFLGGFASLAEHVQVGLRAWATPEPDGEWAPEGSLGAQVRGAVGEFARRQDDLQRHVREVETALPALAQAAQSPGASDEDKRDHRLAEVARRLAVREAKEHRSGHWVSALEERGLLPNYTLLDDSVTLDARVTWLDPDTGEYESDATSVTRPSARALTEFAPGATFYTHELAMRIDGIDVGRDGDKVQSWALCADCGYGAELPAAAAVPSVCPRCASVAIADTGQRYDVVRLEHVYAEVRRDRDRIDDRDDARRRTPFGVVTAADLSEETVQRRWHVGQDLGVTHHRGLELQWINVGPRMKGGTTDRRIAGADVVLAPFRVCAGCGRLDDHAGENSRAEHRPWCPHRDGTTEDVRTVLLTRGLRTEGVVLTLPPHLTLADSFAVPSLTAALLLGLREDIGGAPDHLQVAAVPVPRTEGGGVDDGLLLHDVVPGGTGYLADLAAPERLWRVLVKALRVVAACPCTDEDRSACHRCLLPFAPGGGTEHLSRAAAERHLRSLLGVDKDADVSSLDPEVMGWNPEAGVVVVDPDPESHLERLVRQVFTARVEAAGGQVRQVSGTGGVELVISGLGAMRWRLVPQARMDYVMPDFLLRPEDRSQEDVAVFADGWRYHAAPGHNRIADDARKREDLRADGIAVVAVTHQDLERAQAATAAGTVPDWLSPQAVQAYFAVSGQLGNGTTQAVVEDHRAGPIDLLIGRMQRPADAEARQGLSRGLGALFVSLATTVPLPEADTVAEAALALLDGNVGPDGGEVGYVWRRDHLVVLSRLSPDHASLQTAVVLDDRDAAVDREDHAEAWRAWLQIANAVTPAGFVQVTTATRVLAETRAAAADLGPVDLVPAGAARTVESQMAAAEAAEAALPGEWAGVGPDLVMEDDIAVARALADAGVEVPELVGEEISGLPVSFAWPQRKIAVTVDLPEPDRADLASAGWTVFDSADGLPPIIDRLKG
ncbi:DEAD/DEAH box helicase [Micrococcus sp. HG099]|uniref:DEAD/DEAH box helicase n=1 Tax=Micrococcus sp. HG099 TaxID=2969755 RepID=UPI00215ABA19|nr:DEAD/DEAH box helicase [Micrococcus sp. HG099]MCR8674694.1 DEAD/DEAH box helicase [Micrococcus sp. HG099]